MRRSCRSGICESSATANGGPASAWEFRAAGRAALWPAAWNGPVACAVQSSRGSATASAAQPTAADERSACRQENEQGAHRCRRRPCRRRGGARGRDRARRVLAEADRWRFCREFQLFPGRASQRDERLLAKRAFGKLVGCGQCQRLIGCERCGDWRERGVLEREQRIVERRQSDCERECLERCIAGFPVGVWLLDRSRRFGCCRICRREEGRRRRSPRQGLPDLRGHVARPIDRGPRQPARCRPRHVHG